MDYCKIETVQGRQQGQEVPKWIEDGSDDVVTKTIMARTVVKTVMMTN